MQNFSRLLQRLSPSSPSSLEVYRPPLPRHRPPCPFSRTTATPVHLFLHQVLHYNSCFPRYVSLFPKVNDTISRFHSDRPRHLKKKLMGFLRTSTYDPINLPYDPSLASSWISCSVPPFVIRSCAAPHPQFFEVGIVNIKRYFVTVC